MSVLSVIEWVVWALVVLCGLYFAVGIRLGVRPVTWLTYIMGFALLAVPLPFLFIPLSKLHILWVLVLLYLVSLVAGWAYIPVVSKLLIWPAYVYASILMIGTGERLPSPSVRSPWAIPARVKKLRKLQLQVLRGTASAETVHRIARLQLQLGALVGGGMKAPEMTHAPGSPATLIWKQMLSMPREEFPSIVSQTEIEDAISVLVASKIGPRKFMGNLVCLVAHDDRACQSWQESPELLSTTESIGDFTPLGCRPLVAPLWFLAGFPDVVKWLQDETGLRTLPQPGASDDKTTSKFAALVGVDKALLSDGDEQALDEVLLNDEGELRPEYCGNAITNYKKTTNRSLEAAAEEGSKDDVYLAAEMLGQFGEESNFTLVAGITTRFYLELEKNFADWFPDEAALVAVAGILDAMNYITLGQATPDEIITLAKETENEENNLLGFIVRFEALLFSIDNPEIPYEAVSNACEEQWEAIEQAIDRTRKSYAGDPQLAANVDAFMNSSHFSHLRTMLGVRPRASVE